MFAITFSSVLPLKLSFCRTIAKHIPVTLRMPGPLKCTFEKVPPEASISIMENRFFPILQSGTQVGIPDPWSPSPDNLNILTFLCVSNVAKGYILIHLTGLRSVVRLYKDSALRSVK